MHEICRLVRIVIILLVAHVIATTPEVTAARKPRPEPCPAARYLISGAPLLQGVTVPVTDAVQVGSVTGLGESCTPVAPKRLRANPKGVTQLRVKWSACTGFTGKVGLKGKIIDGCTRLQGTLKAKGFKRTFEALLSRCGDAVVDGGGGEECDDGNTVAGDGCEADCQRTPIPTTTVPTTTTTTTQPSQSTTTSTTATTSTSSTTITTTTTGSTTTTTSGSTTTTTTASTTSTSATSTTTTTRPSTTSTTAATTTTTTGSSTTSTMIIVTTTTTTSSTTTTTTTSTTTTTTLPPRPILGLAMVANPDPATPGAILTYELTVSNRGGAPAPDVQVRLPVPAERASVFACVAASDGGMVPGSCAPLQDVVWNLGALASRASRTVHFSVVVSSALANGARIVSAARATDTSGGRADADVSVDVASPAPLTLVMTESADPVAPGGEVEYVLRFGNRGTASQLGAELAVALPAGVTVLSTSTGATVAGSTVTWALGTLAGGQAGERRVRVRVDDLGAADSRARVVRGTLTGGAGLARAGAVTTVAAGASLALTMVATPDPVRPAAILTYEMTVTNRGAAEAADVELRMPVPAERASVFACIQASDGGAPPGSCAPLQDVVWNLGMLAAGASRTVHFSVQMFGTLPNGTVVHGTARVRDGSGATARAAVSAMVDTGAPLTLLMTESADPVAPGGEVEYVLRFGNRGTASLLGAELAVALPPGVTVQSTTPMTTVVGGTVTWALGTLAGGQAGERRVRVRVDDLGAADPRVRVARATLTSGALLARAGAVTTVAAGAPLALTMVATPDPVRPAAILTYEMTVTNRGAAEAADVELRMPVPAERASVFACVAASDGGAPPGSCAPLQDVVWDLGMLAGGASRTVHFSVQMFGTLPNGTVVLGTARVRDLAGASARAAVSATVDTGAPLTLVMTESVDPVAPGGEVEYVLRFGNRGTTTLTGTELAVELPAGTTLRAQPAGATVAGNTVTWVLGTLAAGQADERRARVRVDNLGAADPRVRVARATVTSGVLLARAGAVTTVTAGAPLALTMVATPDPVRPASILMYALTVTNRGAAEAADVELRMPVPAERASVFACVAVSDGGTPPGSCAPLQDVVWNLGMLAAGANRTVRFSVQMFGTLPDGTVVHGTARVRDVTGASARTATTTVVDSGP